MGWHAMNLFRSSAVRCPLGSYTARAPFSALDRPMVFRWTSSLQVEVFLERQLRLASAEDPRERRSPRLDRAGDRGQDMARPHEVRCRPAPWYITGRHDGVDEMRPRAWRYVHVAYLSIAGLLPTVSPLSRASSPYLRIPFQLGLFSLWGLEARSQSHPLGLRNRREREHVSSPGMCLSDLCNMYVFRVSQVPAFLPRKGLKHKHAG